MLLYLTPLFGLWMHDQHILGCSVFANNFSKCFFKLLHVCFLSYFIFISILAVFRKCKLIKSDSPSRAGFLTFAAAASSSYEVKCLNYYHGILDKVSYFTYIYLTIPYSTNHPDVWQWCRESEEQDSSWCSNKCLSANGWLDSCSPWLYGRDTWYCR